MNNSNEIDKIKKIKSKLIQSFAAVLPDCEIDFDKGNKCFDLTIKIGEIIQVLDFSIMTEVKDNTKETRMKLYIFVKFHDILISHSYTEHTTNLDDLVTKIKNDLLIVCS